MYENIEEGSYCQGSKSLSSNGKQSVKSKLEWSLMFKKKKKSPFQCIFKLLFQVKISLFCLFSALSSHFLPIQTLPCRGSLESWLGNNKSCSKFLNSLSQLQHEGISGWSHFCSMFSTQIPSVQKGKAGQWHTKMCKKQERTLSRCPLHWQQEVDFLNSPLHCSCHCFSQSIII